MSNQDNILNQRYELLAQLGAGGMSVIYKAQDLMLGREVAVKTLRTNWLNDMNFVQRFQDEARAIARLKHPNIVTVYDVGSQMTPKGPIYYIVMELINGRDLKKIIKEVGGPFQVARTLDLVIQVCDGIGYAHQKNLVHADIKPQNIMVVLQPQANQAPREQVIVTDFGIAQVLSDTQPQRKSDVVWGSPHYFSPEQAQGLPPSPESDVYSIGIMLFELLTGKLPYGGATATDLGLAHVRERIPRVTELNPSAPEELSNIVYKAMSKEAKQRYRDGDQMASVLRAFRDKLNKSTLPMSSQSAVTSSPAAPTPPTILNSAARTVQASPPPSLQTIPAQRPPAGQIPPAPSAEPTARYSAAPVAPQPYVPSPQAPFGGQPPQVPIYPNAPISAPQPLNQPIAGYSAQPSYPLTHPTDPMHYSAQYPATLEEDGPDYVTIALAVLALLAVLGLFPLWLLALSVRA
ncbi:MAG: protein kinase [Anaerolineae bacterium]|nr:protein kinase [Anaerolineae bacterium]MDW8173253.1 protein kinase [Anaerolineae bacterium]